MTVLYKPTHNMDSGLFDRFQKEIGRRLQGTTMLSINRYPIN